MNRPDAKAVGRRLRRLRFEAGLSQRDLAAPGVTYAYISRLEAGSRRASMRALIMLGEKLGVTGLELLTGDAHADCPFCGRSGKSGASDGAPRTTEIRTADEGLTRERRRNAAS